MRNRAGFLGGMFLLAMFFLAGCTNAPNSGSASPSATRTAAPSRTRTPSPTVTPTATGIPTEYLPLADDPLNPGGRIIPLFGEGFTIWDPFGPLTRKDGCLIAGAGPDGGGHCAVTVNGHSDPLFGSADLHADNITFLSVSFSNIPMDLPGVWHIAVEISVRPAVYAGGRIENITDISDYPRIPNQGFKYQIPIHTFITYMWISTPCNPAEVDGCRN